MQCLQVGRNTSNQGCKSATIFELYPPGQMLPMYMNILEEGHHPYKTIHLTPLWFHRSF